MRQRSELVKSKITDSAGELFLSRGYVGTTVDAIAKRTGVTKRTVYGYFPDKQTIFKEVVEVAVGDPWEFQIPLTAIVTTESLHTALCLIGTSVDEVISRPDYVRLLRLTIAEIPMQQDLSLLLERGVIGRALPVVAGVLHTAQALEIIQVTDVEAASKQFVGGLAVRIFLDGLLRPSSDYLHRLTTAELRSYVDSFMGRVANRRSAYSYKI